MTIKEELKEEVRDEGGDEDELDALEALEKEAAEYNKVCLPSSSRVVQSTNGLLLEC